MFAIGQEVIFARKYGRVTALAPIEDAEKQGMVEITIHGQDPQWVGECFVKIVTDEMRRRRYRWDSIEFSIFIGDYPGGPYYTGDWPEP